jgi:predicted  nucleic acid-binding Zn-ribbon protein
MEVVSKNPLTSDFAVLFQRIVTLAEELDSMREYYRELQQERHRLQPSLQMMFHSVGCLILL